MNEKLYAELVKVAESGERLTRFNMVSYCVGYYGKVDKEIWEVILKLFTDGFID